MANRDVQTVKARLAMRDDISDRAAGLRLRASISALGLTQTAFAERSGQKLTAVLNQTAGRNHPSRRSMHTLWYDFRVDPTFIMFGYYGHLPADRQDRIFDALAQQERDLSE